MTAGLTKQGIDVRGKVIEALLIATLAGSLLILAVLIGDMVQRSWSVWTDRGTDFLTSGLSITDASEAGVWPGIKGTIVLMFLVVLLAFPLGIACAILAAHAQGLATIWRSRGGRVQRRDQSLLRPAGLCPSDRLRLPRLRQRPRPNQGTNVARRRHPVARLGRLSLSANAAIRHRREGVRWSLLRSKKMPPMPLT